MANYVSYENILTIIDDIKEWVKDKLSLKQDKLTPGANITITSDNVISMQRDSVVIIDASNYTQYLKQSQYEYMAGDTLIVKNLKGWTLDLSQNGNDVFGTYYFDESLKNVINAENPIMRIGSWRWVEGDAASLNKNNGKRITLMGYFKLGMYAEAPSGYTVNGSIPYYYGNAVYDTEKDATNYEALIEAEGDASKNYICDASSKCHFIDLMCWKLCWYTKGYIK